jgi:tetratricopeptide (TPR) repeat protein
MKEFMKPLLLIAGLSLLPTPALAQRDQLFVGARPLALGETFVAIADDGNASYWNPAGMPFIRRQELNSMYNDLYGLGINNGFLSLLHPISRRHSIGGNWLYDGFDDGELGYSRNIFTLSYGFALNENFALGANLKYLQLRVNLDDSIAVAKGNGFGADLGALFTYTFKKRAFPKKAQLGLMAHDFTNTKMKYRGSNIRDTILRRNLRIGAAVQPFDQLTTRWLTLSESLLAFDLDDRWHVGAELWLNRALALRGGLQNDLDPREGAILSFGAGVRWQFLQFDYAYTVPPTLGETHRFSLSLRSDENPFWVSIEEAKIERVFASLYRYYENPESAKFNTVFIKNTHDDTVTAFVSLNVKHYATAPTEQKIKLAPGELKAVHLHAHFSKKLLNITGDSEKLKADVKVRYRYKDAWAEDRKTVAFRVHGIGTIDWEDPGRAAAFVTQLDPCVRAFAEKVLTSYPQPPKSLWIANKSHAVNRAMLLFAALRGLKLSYLPDPNREVGTIDTIHYPRRFLNGEQMAGDCDDLTVLYASLLESCGIETAFLSTRDHFFLMFNTGLHSNYPVPYDENLFVAWNNTLWMPIETTVAVQDGTFGEAWEEGAANYRDYKNNDDLENLLVSEHQQRYRPAEFESESPCAPPISPESVQYGMEEKTQQLLDRLYAVAQQQPESLAVRNHIGLVWALVGEEPKAEKEFRLILNRKSNYVPAINNLANIKFILEDYETADSLYAHALQHDPDQAGIYLNRAVLAQIRREEAIDKNQNNKAKTLQSLSEAMLTEAARRLEADTTRAFALLGFSFETDDGGKAGIREELNERIKKIKKLIGRAFHQYLKQRFIKNVILERAVMPKGGAEEEDHRTTLWWSRDANSL